MSTKTDSSYNGAKFYYDRHHYAIEFYSPTTLLKKTEKVPYQSPLSSYNWTPDASQAPAQYEPGSVVFEGWYLNPECTGDKFDFATETMPAGTKDGDTTLTLYAKWADGDPVEGTICPICGDHDALILLCGRCWLILLLILAGIAAAYRYWKNKKKNEERKEI